MASHRHETYPLRKLRINFCKETDMHVLPGVGRKAAEQISEFISLHGNITTENVFDIPNLKVSEQFFQIIDFARNPDYSSVPGRTNSREQEYTNKSTTHPAVSWNRQSVTRSCQYGSPENGSWSDKHIKTNAYIRSRRKSECTPEDNPARRPAYSPGGTPAHIESTCSRRARTALRLHPAHQRKDLSSRRPAYSPGGTPARVLPVDEDYWVVLPKNLSRQHTREAPTNKLARRPAYSPGGTPARTRSFRSHAYSVGVEKPAHRQFICSSRGRWDHQYQPDYTSEESSASYSSSDDDELSKAEDPQEKFLLASQTQYGNFFEWADRVRMLADDAFTGKPQSCRNTLSISLFCHGCSDQEAGQFALDKHPGTLNMALVYVKQHIKARHQMQLQSSEDGLAIVSPTKEQNIAQSEPLIKSPVCDSFMSKTTSKSSVTKLSAATPIAQKQSKAKRKKAKKAKSCQ